MLYDPSLHWLFHFNTMRCKTLQKKNTCFTVLPILSKSRMNLSPEKAPIKSRATWPFKVTYTIKKDDLLRLSENFRIITCTAHHKTEQEIIYLHGRRRPTTDWIYSIFCVKAHLSSINTAVLQVWWSQNDANRFCKPHECFNTTSTRENLKPCRYLQHSRAKLNRWVM